MKILITGGSGFIGTNLIEYLQSDHELYNLDWNPPLNPAHTRYWHECDIMNETRVISHFQRFAPSVVIHLAARTDTDIYDLEGDLTEYIQNTTGTQTILNGIKKTPSVSRVIVTSSMFVCKAGHLPAHDEDFNPFTLYGVSKRLTETYTRKAGLECIWTIIRPQTIWGPWSMRYKNAMFRVMKKGLYFHPNKTNVQRSYGYSGNVVWQIEQIIKAPKELVHGQVYYVGDRPVNLLEWAQCISRHLVGRPVRVVPASLVKGIANGGDILKKLGISFPITSTRFNSMVEDYLTPIERTLHSLGEPPYSMEKGVEMFVDWHENKSHIANTSTERRVVVTYQPLPNTPF